MIEEEQGGKGRGRLCDRSRRNKEGRRGEGCVIEEEQKGKGRGRLCDRGGTKREGKGKVV